MSNRIKERWAFTLTDIMQPQSCSRDDEFLATGMDNAEVVVDRRGMATNRYRDGTKGVTAIDKERAESEDTIVQVRTMQVADNWHDVWTNDEGKFLGYATKH